MKLLLLAPHPFFITRGSPIAVDLMLQVLSARGDEIDVLTYHQGSARSYKNVALHRIRPWPNVADVPPGLSWKKILCDVFLFCKFLRFLITNRYDLVIAVEETAFMALALCWIRRTPFLCDVDSSMTAQIIARNGTPKLLQHRAFERTLRALETVPIRFAEGVIAMCDELATDLTKYHPKRMLVLRDVSLIDQDLNQATASRLTNQHKQAQVVMYIGNLEPYQGVQLLIDSFATAVSQHAHPTQLMIVGGSEQQIKSYAHQTAQLGIASLVRFVGTQPLEKLSDYASQADILVSPRIQGVNTPMKIYSYLDSGAAVLATDLPTHTQIVNESIAALAPPDRKAFSQALLKLLEQPDLRAQLASNARAFIRERHSFHAYRETLSGFFLEIEGSLSKANGKAA